MKAVWNGGVLAESDDIVTLEGNMYFPMESLNDECFEQSKSMYLCLWKGKGSRMSYLQFKRFWKSRGKKKS